MTNPELFALMDRFEQSGLRALKLSTPGFSLELDRGTGVPAASVPAPSAVPAPPAPTAEKEEAKTIDAPLVGTFYAGPSPDQPPFVTAGARVSKGQTVCLIEAMKMMSEVPAPCDCVIEEALKKDGQLAAFGDPLFRYTPC
ncbi:MAG: acetyl-CoA carboxylase biotin carboxyl carrier protein subunit [Oscillibacter sp.]|nr:acetyl-CoA carboxylase biotin carboxyl carrier protein subunit [Oscillibacter sp.]